MLRDNDFNDLVNKAFHKHGVDNDDLKNAIVDILEQTLDSRTLARRIWKDVEERIEFEKKRSADFR